MGVELVGRDAELAVLARAVADVRGGRTRVLGVIGEAGIGKTELLGALAEHAREAGLLVLEGRCAEHERDVPFGVVIDALDEHVATLAPRRVETVGPELAAVLPAAAERPGAAVTARAGAAERFRYHRALRGLLELLARERPVALLLDDLHWADEASLEFVLHLLRRPPRAACLLVFALRPGDRGARLLAAARATPGWQHLPLGPLSEEAARSLLAELPDAAVRERVVGETAGNPLLLRELGRLARAGESALPATLTAAVGLDVAALEPAARALIEGAAVAGDPFDPELAAAAAGIEPDAAALDRLVAAELVRATGDGRSFAFRHPLVRRVVYDGAPPAWRLDAHERAAAALARRGAGAVARAYHVERSALVGDEAAIALLCAAAEAAGLASPADAAHWYAGALRLVREDEHERRGGLLAQLALALMAVGRYEQARDALLEALAHPGETWLVLTILHARTETLLGRHAEARRRLLAARAAAPPEARAELSFELAMVAFNTGRGEDLRAWTGPAVQAAREVGRPVVLAGAEGLAALGELWGDNPEASAAALERATSLLDGLDDSALGQFCALAPSLVGVAQQLSEQFAAASATAGRLLALMRRTGQGQGLVTALALRAVARLQLLDLDEALQHADSAEEVARLQRVPHLLHLALWLRAVVHDVRGEAAEVDRAVREAQRLIGAIEPSKLSRTGDCDLAYLGTPNDPQRAIEQMKAAAGADLEHADPTWRSWLLLRIVRVAIAAGRLDDAERWAATATRHTTRLGLPAGAVRAACARAEVLLARGEAGRAAALATEALAAAERAGAPLDALEARLLAGRALAAAGDAEPAKQALQRVAADAGRGGALRPRDAAARELRRLGTRVSAHGRRAAHTRSPATLTERERRIAELVADGHPNKHIAATLFLSEKTVRNALTRVYAKLDVRSRSQLARTLTSS
jgi:DNA-binding CsgD family transcriptional regulator